MSEIIVRRAKLADAETVADLVHALLDELSGGGAPAIEPFRQQARSVLAGDKVVAVLACINDEPAGVMTLNECAAIYAGGKFGEISELYVEPRARSKGVAQHLLAFAQEEGQRLGWRRLEVGAPPQPAWSRTLAFYHAIGFADVGPRLRRLI